MNLTRLTIEKYKISYFVVLLLIVGGIFSYTQLGQLEDPEFTVKTASVITQYPGASASQVELEVTDLLETKLQEMSEIKNVYSISKPGLSIIKVDIKNEYWADRLPQVWDHLRKRIDDVKAELPPQAGIPQIGDDFGFVFGFLMAVTSDGYTYAELEDYVKNIRKELNLVPGVARVDLWGVQTKQVYIDVSKTKMTQLKIRPDTLLGILKQQNMVIDSGHMDVQDSRFRLVTMGEFKSPKEIENLVVGATEAPKNQTGQSSGASHRSELIRIKDIGTVRLGYQEPPLNQMRYNGHPAIGIALATLPGVNAVQVGKEVDKKLQELQSKLPVGIEINKISWQSDLVEESIQAFMINLLEAVGIVFVVLAITMGIRMGLIIGVSGLVFPILGTFIVMYLMNIDLQRVSLGAMIIAMGMMVDNAIVVADGFVVRLNQGVSRVKAAVQAASQPSWPLLGATIIASMAFYPIFASDYDTGEYARSLFQVVAISLILSWLMSLSITPLMAVKFIPAPKEKIDSNAQYASGFYQKFRGLLELGIRFRLIFIMSMLGLLVLSAYSFKLVPQMFFPDSSRLQLMIDYWAPEGTRIQTTSKNLEKIEQQLKTYPEVTGVAAFIGQGPPRFYLPVNPEDPYSSYAQLIVNTNSLAGVDKVIDKITPWLAENSPEALVRVRKYGVGAFDDWKFEARFSGPAEADPQVLRELGQQGVGILKNTPIAKEARTNWRQRVRRMDMQFDQKRSRWLGVSRDDVAEATKRAYDGTVVGLYREGDDMIPIILRNVENERKAATDHLDNVQMVPKSSTEAMPISQVLTGVKYAWEDPIIQRWDRRRAITVQASPNQATATELRNSVLKQFESIKLPPGYRLEWDGEYKSSQESVQALIPGIVPTIVVILLIIVVLFNAYRPPIIIVAAIPFVMIGITFGLLITQVPFGFIALLGAMSLSGMMIKNSIVLLDQVNINLSEGMTPYRAVVEAAVSRLRPVVNAAATTVFGMMPLLQDVFWVSMAITIIFGLAFGTLITMFLVPILYATLYKITKPSQPTDAD